MPSLAKPSRKSGAPKSKGAVRAKSGCYTCRIRRKKCDEQRTSDGYCETCVRLHIQCLGFGAKRPEWLRDSRIVGELRERIKSFLTSQGMLKGTSGSGPRLSDNEATILRLTDNHNGYSSSSATPPTPVLSLPEPDFRAGPMLSSERDHPYPHATLPYVRSTGISPLDPDVPFAANGRALYSHEDLPFASVTPSSNLVSDLPTWPNTTEYPPQSFRSPASFSSFSQTYHSRELHAYTSQELYDDEYEALSFQLSPTAATYNSRPRDLSISSSSSDRLVMYYMTNVLKIQYLLTDQQKTSHFMRDLIYSSEVAREAVCLLSEVHQFCIQNGGLMSNVEIQRRYKTVYDKLIASKPALGSETEGEALAGLHVVSSFLFVGGSGEWLNFLALACRYSRRILHNPAYGSVSQALLCCSEAERFIVKTTLWFDVLASASQVTVPFFLEEIRELFDPTGARIDGPQPAELDMISPMGCKNHVVWAMAEISNLACWKLEGQRNGRPSMPELVERGLQIEQHLLQHGPIPTFTADNVQNHRHFTSEIFRASARVYLHSVLSGDYPSCPEIQNAVNETVNLIERVPPLEDMSRSVIRSVVFGIFMCGCFTVSVQQRDLLLSRLTEETTRAAVGNCSRVKDMVEEIWKDRIRRPTEPVRWKELLKNYCMLLV